MSGRFSAATLKVMHQGRHHTHHAPQHDFRVMRLPLKGKERWGGVRVVGPEKQEHVAAVLTFGPHVSTRRHPLEKGLQRYIL
jgi:hypothetical protein